MDNRLCHSGHHLSSSPGSIRKGIHPHLHLSNPLSALRAIGSIFVKKKGVGLGVGKRGSKKWCVVPFRSPSPLSPCPSFSHFSCLVLKVCLVSLTKARKGKKLLPIFPFVLPDGAVPVWFICV